MSRPNRAVRFFITALSWAAAILYPAAVYAGIRTGHLAAVALLLCAIALVRWIRSPTGGNLAIAAIAIALSAAALLFADALPLKFYPVAMNAAFLFVFGRSLLSTPIVEKFARMKESDLPAQASAYCRRVTQAWCVFFVLNGLAALDSALFRSDAWWTLYNGLIAYILIGAMFAGEFLIRTIVRRRAPSSSPIR